MHGDTSTTIRTLSIAIARDPAAVFAFLADGENWPRWAVHNVSAARRLAANEWEIMTPRGPGRLCLSPDARHGIIDHAFIDAQQGRWQVPGRVVAAGDGAVVVLTLTRPPAMPEAGFLTGMAQFEDELATLKRVLEA